MKKAWMIAILFIITPLITAPPCLGNNYDVWNDETYDFHNVQQIYINEINTAPLGLKSTIKEYRLKAYFFEKAKTLKGWTVTIPPLSPPAAPAGTAQNESQSSRPSSVTVSGAISSNPGNAVAAKEESTPLSEEEIVSDETITPTNSDPLSNQPQPPDPIKNIPDDVISSNADIYVTAQMLAYQVGTGLIPAHMEWDSYWLRDVYYDRRGHPRWFARHVMYPVYVPNTYIPVSSVGVQFCVYDVATGRLISISEDIRTRGSSDDVYGVYKRIIDRFFKNLKKQMTSS